MEYRPKVTAYTSAHMCMCMKMLKRVCLYTLDKQTTIRFCPAKSCVENESSAGTRIYK